ncbi:MAG: bifunctional proline dehydrogenase/L-glutamate gamma-semialdehyde dehydrogenase, partial [Actinomycetes bacterium]|nr:bifunctional proline dehydrogenase/L-glutamate gamma-semialdehyde dehydrogenase [Actinomycetes bacterium]
MDRTDARTELTESGREAVDLARRWVAESADHPVDYAARVLSQVLEDPHGLEFTVRFVDGVIRPQDQNVAARTLARLARRDLGFLPPYLAAGLKAAGPSAVAAPEIVVPAARRIFRQLVGDLILDTTGEGLTEALARARAAGNRVNVNLLGEAVLGDKEAARRLAANSRLLARDDVDYISLKVSAVTGPHNPWGFDEVVQHAVDQLLPFYLDAATAPTPKFINLDMEDYKDLALTLAVFRQLLDHPALLYYEAGIVLQAYQPDALAAMMELQDWAEARVNAGGARIKVRLVKGANLAMERVDAEMHDWPLTTWPTKLDTDSHYKRVMEWAMTPERTRNIRLGIAGQNIFDIALAWVLAGRRGVREDVEIEMLSGMATGLAEVVRREVGHLLLYIPVVDPKEFDVAIAYLVRRLEENSLPENFMSGVFDIASDTAVFDREAERFLAALYAVDLDAPVPTPMRTQDRGRETAEDIAAVVRADGAWTFRNTPDTDPVLPGNREWAREIVRRVPTSELGIAEADAAVVGAVEEIDRIREETAGAAVGWGARPAAERAEIIHRVGVELGLRRAELLEVAAAEAGKTLDQGDPEVSEAIDFCHWYAERARELEQLDGARFVPSKVTVVTPPWNFPLAIPTGGVVAALAAGSAVVFKPATPARRSGARLAEAMWAAGVPRDVLRLVQTPDRAVGKHLISHPRVDRGILTGSYDTAKLFRSWRPELPLLAETSGKNSIIVTPSADPDLAVKDVAYSAFGHAGQKCSAGSLVILVGSMATSRRFRDQLVDAVRSLHVAWPSDPSS